MDINELHQNWTTLGQDDPMWVVLTDPAKKGNRWDEREFFETGRADIARSLTRCAQHGVALQFGKALDFGCGLGRLSQALGEKFSAVDGVDISSSMIEQARKLNRQPAKVSFHLNVQPDLAAFASASYDFVFSLIALQHTPSKFQRRYVADFLRLLKPGGTAQFQTIHGRGWRAWVPDGCADTYRKFKHGQKAFIPMYGLPVATVKQLIAASGARLIAHKSETHSERPDRFVTDHYLVTKPA
jgi:SAM-dependent methyltransferase